MAGRRKSTANTATVNSVTGLNLREAPSLKSKIVRILQYGEKISIDNESTAPKGWKAVSGGGFVMAEYLD